LGGAALVTSGKVTGGPGGDEINTGLN